MAEAKMIKFPQDSVILREGDVNADMYKIVKGHAEVYVGYGTPSERILGVIGPQSCFGELGPLLGKSSIYTVIAYSDVLVLRISEKDLGSFVAENQKNIIDIMRNMAGSMLSMRSQIDQLLQDLEYVQKTDETDEKIRINIRDARRAMRQYAIYNPMLKKT